MASYKPPLQLNIPVALPGILKEYTKAVLQFQPEDLYTWSAKYFRELADSNILNEESDSQLRSKQIDVELDRSISFDGWKSIYNKVRDSDSLTFDQLSQLWLADRFSESQLKELLTVGEFYSGEISLHKFSVLVCASLAENLRKTMQNFVILVSGDEPKSAKIQYDLFQSSYQFVASLDSDVSKSTIDKVLNYLKKVSQKNGGYVSIDNFMNKLCPNLE